MDIYSRMLSVSEKLPVFKFRYVGKYLIKLDGVLDGYYYVHVSGQQHTGLEKNTSSTSLGTMMHMMPVLFVFFAVFEKLNASFS